MPRTGAASEVPGRMAADHCLQLSRTDLSECLWPLFGAADFQPTTWGTQGLALFKFQLEVLLLVLMECTLQSARGGALDTSTLLPWHLDVSQEWRTF